MSFKEILERAKQKKEARKEMFKQMQDQQKMEKLLEERNKSADLRELESYYKEIEDKQVKEQLEIMRKRRKHDLDFNHNPLHAKNIMKDSGFNVLKQKNLFKNHGNMFVGQPFIHKNNPKLLNNNRRLYGI